MALMDWLPFGRRRPMVTVVRLSGAIGMRMPLQGGLTLQSVAPALERAFRGRGLAAVALVINSPGGSPVQSALIHDRIRALAAERKVPVIAFVEDVAASGGYWLACAADEIFTDASSIVGSIGVISAGFGFPRALERLGIERRLHTSGERKSMLDPFSPERPEDVARLERLQADIHEAFKTMVRTRRAGRLKGDESELFSGEFWLGGRAVALGLVDGIGDLRGTLRARFGSKVRLRPVATQPRGWRRRLGLVEAADALPGALLAAVEERALWSRFGL